MKKTKILLVSMTALLLASCGTKKAVIQQKPVQDNKVAQQTAPAPKDNKMESLVVMPVSYTHLTLPTILRV